MYTWLSDIWKPLVYIALKFRYKNFIYLEIIVLKMCIYAWMHFTVEIKNQNVTLNIFLIPSVPWHLEETHPSVFCFYKDLHWKVCINKIIQFYYYYYYESNIFLSNEFLLNYLCFMYVHMHMCVWHTYSIPLFYCNRFWITTYEGHTICPLAFSIMHS